MSTQLLQRGAAAPCVSRRTCRLSSGSSACNSGRPLSSAAARRQEARAAALQVVCSLNNSAGTMAPKPAKLEARETLRLALPSKGRMAEDTLQLLKDCQLSVVKPNPRQYVARISQLPGLEVWFQRATDVVRKIIYGDVDLGIVGLDMLAEIGNDDPDVVILHDALDFGQCHLALGVPMGGRFADINSLEELRAMTWSEQAPLRVVTGYQNIARKFFADKGFEHVVLLSADGERAGGRRPPWALPTSFWTWCPTGVTLRENNLKQIDGGTIMHRLGGRDCQPPRAAGAPGPAGGCHELIERLEAHLTADKYYSVIANMRGSSAEEVSKRLLDVPGLAGLSGPTVSPVFTRGTSVICVPKKQLYPAVKEIRRVGGSGVLVQPMTYIL
ncbi:hypothetical protein ABPG77_004566 [Micractinium sp. CCAP 211/92]